MLHLIGNQLSRFKKLAKHRKAERRSWKQKRLAFQGGTST
jgi:hypothetical protein